MRLDQCCRVSGWLLIIQISSISSLRVPMPAFPCYPSISKYHHAKSRLPLFLSTDDQNPTNEPEGNKKRRKKSPIQWIACSSTKEVTRAIQMYIKEGDTVAELGSQLRDSSIALCDAIGPTGRALLVDTERKFPNAKKERQRTKAMRMDCNEDGGFFTDRAQFVETKSFEYWRHALFFRGFEQSQISVHDKGNDQDLRSQYNALVVDMSTVAGNDLELTCISLIREFLALNSGGSGELNQTNKDDADHNPCRVVIVKSRSLHSLARRLFHAQKLLNGSGIDSLNDNPHGTSIIATVGVDEYRKMIPYAVRKGDQVIELGSHFGTSTVLLHDAARGEGDDVDLSNGGCIGVDVGPNIIESARKKYPHVPFVVGDAWKIAELARLRSVYLNRLQSTDTIYDAVFVDVGGLSGSEGLLEAISLLSSISNGFEPRCIVIKSLCMRRLASSLVPFSAIWKKQKQTLQ